MPRSPWVPRGGRECPATQQSAEPLGIRPVQVVEQEERQYREGEASPRMPARHVWVATAPPITRSAGSTKTPPSTNKRRGTTWTGREGRWVGQLLDLWPLGECLYIAPRAHPNDRRVFPEVPRLVEELRCGCWSRRPPRSPLGPPCRRPGQSTLRGRGRRRGRWPARRRRGRPGAAAGAGSPPPGRPGPGARRELPPGSWSGRRRRRAGSPPRPGLLPAAGPGRRRPRGPLLPARTRRPARRGGV